MNEFFGEEALRRAGWLSETPAEFQSAVLSRCDRIRIGAGQSVYHFGDDVGGIVGVVQGRMEIHARSNGQDPTLIFVAGPGFWTGEYATATGQPRVISLVAHSDLSLVRLPRAEFLRIAAADPLAWQRLSVLATRNLALAVELIGMLKCAEPVDRLGNALLLMYRQLAPGTRLIQTSQADLGAITRMSRGSVNAALKELEDRGLARPVYRGIEITDPARLQAEIVGD